VLAIFVDYALENPPLIIISLLILILTRGAISIFYSAISPVSAAFVADKVEPKQRSNYMAKLGAANGMGMIFGPIAGGALAIYGLETPLYTFAILPFIAAIVLYFSIKRAPKIHIEKEIETKFLDKRLFIPIFSAFLTMFAFMTINSCLGFFALDIFKLNDLEAAKVTGYILGSIGLTLIVAQIIVTKITTPQPHTFMKLGTILLAIGMIGMAYSLEIWLSLLFSSLFGFGMGFLFPSIMTITANSVEDYEQGYAAGTVSSANGIGMIFGPLVSTALYGFSSSLPFVFSGLLFFILLLLIYRKFDVDDSSH
jgi:MFS family permease